MRFSRRPQRKPRGLAFRKVTPCTLTIFISIAFTIIKKDKAVINMSKSSLKNYSKINQIILPFDEEASQYDLERTAVGYRIRHILIRSLLLEVCKHGNLALDLGCGTGEYAILMERMGFTVIGVDFSKAMLLVAKSKKRKSRISDQLQLVRSECSRLPFKDGLFDVVVCISVLDLIPFYNKLLNEIYRVLKYRGKLILCVDSLWSPSWICTVVRELLCRRKNSEHAPDVLHYKNLTNSMKIEGFIIEKFIGDFLLGQLLTPFLFDPKRNNVAEKMLKVVQPLDFYLMRISLLKPFSAHYIIQARKGNEELERQLHSALT